MEAGAYVALKSAAIYDMASFHAESRRALGFPESYRGDMDAWAECLASVRAPEGERLVGTHVEPGEMLQLEVPDLAELQERAPDVVEALVAAVAAVNQHCLALGQAPAVALILS